MKLQRLYNRKVCIQNNSFAEFSSSSFPEPFRSFFIPKFPQINFRESRMYHEAPITIIKKINKI